MATLKIGVLGSGSGTNMQSIQDAIDRGELDARIVCVIADVPDAKILDRARRHGIPADYLDPAPWKTKLEGPAEDRYIEHLRAHGAEVVALAGFMRIVKPKLLAAFPNRVLNIHPALLPAFPGVAAGVALYEMLRQQGANESEENFPAVELPPEPETAEPDPAALELPPETESAEPEPAAAEPAPSSFE